MKNLYRPLKKFSGIPMITLALLAILAYTASRVWKHDFLPENHQSSVPHSEGVDQATKQQIVAAYGKLPMRFEVNAGQLDEQVKFVTRGSGYSMFLTENEAVMSLRKSQVSSDAQPESSDQDPATSTVVRMKLIGANQNPIVTGQDEMITKSNYLVGPRSEWRTDVANYKKVHYNEVYDGIDMVYYGNQQRLEYDFIVAPGVDPNKIKLQFEGLHESSEQPAMVIADNGDLILQTEDGELCQQKPIVYQKIAGERYDIDGYYALYENNHVGFTLGDYDAAHPVVIDPILVYSTFLGGTGRDQGNAIAVDASGNVYITGNTESIDFPTTAGAVQITKGLFSAPDAFVSKLNPAGTALIYSTYLGGNDFDRGNDIAVDGSGNAYVTGGTTSENFPTTSGAFGRTIHGAGSCFVSKLNPSGTALIYSTVIGTFAKCAGIAINGSGNAYVVGDTEASNFPTTPGAFQEIDPNGDAVFVTKFNATGSDLIYSTYLGGIISTSNDRAGAIAIDGSGNAYVTGSTETDDFPTTGGAFDVSLGGASDAFVSKLNADGSDLVYSTFLGGTTDGDGGSDIAVDGSGNAYVTGETRSNDFPITAGAFQITKPSALGDRDAYVSKLNAAGSDLIYSTYLGGVSEDEEGFGIAVDSSGNAYVTGFTESNDFPTSTDAFDLSLGGVADAFLSQLNPSGSALLYSTYLGGAVSTEAGNGIAVDDSGNVYLTGRTASSDFPTTAGAFETSFQGGTNDGFVAKFGGFASELHKFVFLAERKIDLDHYESVQGDMHSNGNIKYDNGRPGLHHGSATAVGDISIERKNTVTADGDLTAGGSIDIDDDATVDGAVTAGATVATEALPTLSFSCTGANGSVFIDKDDEEDVAPGDYGVIRARKDADLNFSSGEYFIGTLKLDHKAKLNVNVNAGAVIINVCDVVKFRKNAEIIITGGTSEDLFINYSGTKKMEFGKDGSYQGTINAPNARVKLNSGAGFLGSICARIIDVRKDARVRHHSVAGGIPKATSSSDEVAANAPGEITLGNFPNPFNPTTKIQFALPAAGTAKLQIFDMLGRRVNTLVNAPLQAGSHAYTWNGRNSAGNVVAAGMYIYRLTIQSADGSAQVVKTQKMAFVK